MKIAIMQPYLFPYIGYFQLINYVDTFVLLDDVNYIKRGYINHNTILINGKEFRYTIPVENASQNRLIKDMSFCDSELGTLKLIKSVELGYKKSEFFSLGMPLVREILLDSHKDITSKVELSINMIFEYLGKDINIIRASKIGNEHNLKSTERIIDICKKLGADTYINPQGGRNLYNWKDFADKSIDMYFLDVDFDNIIYSQLSDTFVSSLSIIDMLMNCDKNMIGYFLEKFTLNKE